MITGGNFMVYIADLYMQYLVKMKNNYTPLPKPLITTITSSLDSIFNLIKTMVIKLIYMFSAHFQIMPKFDNMVLSDLVLFKDGMYFIYSLTETLSNYGDYSINKKQFLVHHVNYIVRRSNIHA